MSGRYLGLHDDAGTPLLVLDDGDNLDVWAVTKVDLGSPDVREQVTSRTWADGTVDRTAWVGSRGITIEATAVAGQSAVDDLRGWCHPSQRPWLHVELDGWAGRRRIQVRGASITGDLTDLQPDIQCQLKGPAGVLEDVDATTVTVMPGGGTEAGIRPPLAFPMQFPAGGAGPSAATLTVGGTAPTWPIIDLHGPMTSPVVHLLGTPDQQLSLPFMVIAAGSFLRLDTAARTITMNADPAQSWYSSLDFTVSDWWPLVPGTNLLALTAGTASAGSSAAVTWRSRWL